MQRSSKERLARRMRTPPAKVTDWKNPNLPLCCPVIGWEWSARGMASEHGVELFVPSVTFAPTAGDDVFSCLTSPFLQLTPRGYSYIHASSKYTHLPNMCISVCMYGWISQRSRCHLSALGFFYFYYFFQILLFLKSSLHPTSGSNSLPGVEKSHTLHWLSLPGAPPIHAFIGIPYIEIHEASVGLENSDHDGVPQRLF